MGEAEDDFMTQSLVVLKALVEGLGLVPGEWNNTNRILKRAISELNQRWLFLLRGTMSIRAPPKEGSDKENRTIIRKKGERKLWHFLIQQLQFYRPL